MYYIHSFILYHLWNAFAIIILIQKHPKLSWHMIDTDITGRMVNQYVYKIQQEHQLFNLCYTISFVWGGQLFSIVMKSKEASRLSGHVYKKKTLIISMANKAIRNGEQI